MRIQIGIDDLSPRPTQSLELWENVQTLLDLGLKVDLFVTFAMKRDWDGPYLLTDYPEFVESLRSISELSGVALNVHGYKHSWGSNNNDEFLYAPKDVLAERLDNIDRIIKETDLPFTKVFRPPAWKISRDGVDLLIQHGYTHLSLIRGRTGNSYYSKIYDVLDLSKLKVHHCDSAPPHYPLGEGDIAATYHFSTFLDNAISKENCDQLLSHIGDKEISPYWIKET